MLKNRYNAPQRLLEIMQALDATEYNDQTSFQDILRTNFPEVKTLRDAHLFKVGLIDLAREIEDVVLSNEEIEDDWLDDLQGIFHICNEKKLDVAWRSIKARINDSGIKALKAYSGFFTSVCDEKKISDEQVAEIQEQLDQIANSVSELDNNDLRTSLLSILEAARRCLAEYRIYGAKALEKPLKTAIGNMFIEFGKQTPTPDEKKVVDQVIGVVQKMGKTAGDLNQIYSFGLKVADVTKALMP